MDDWKNEIKVNLLENHVVEKTTKKGVRYCNIEADKNAANCSIQYLFAA